MNCDHLFENYKNYLKLRKKYRLKMSESARKGLIQYMTATGLSYAALGREMGVTRERIRQIVLGKRLLHPATAKRIKKFLKEKGNK